MKNKTKLLLSSKRQIVIYITIITIIFSIGGNWYYGREKEKIILQKEKTLSAIATLKAKQIEMWYNEELKDVQVISANPYLEEFVKKYDSNSLIDRTRLLDLLNQIQLEHELAEVFLTSLEGEIIASSNSQITPIYPDELRSLKKAIQHDKAVSTGFFNAKQNGKMQLFISFLSEVNCEVNNLSYAIIMRQVAANEILPLIKSWPTESNTGESFIFCYETNSIILFNKYQQLVKIEKSDNPKVKIDDLLSQIYTSKKPGLYQGKDYRNVDVLASMSNIEGTSWVLISKIDKNELLKELNNEALSIIIWVLLFITLSSIFMFFLFNNRQKNIYKGLLEKERELWEQQEKFNVVMDSIGDGIITVDLNGNIKYLNNRAEELTGWKFEEAIGRDFHEVYNVINEETGLQENNILDKVLKKGIVKDLGNHTILISKNGTKIPVMDTGAPLFDESGKVIGIAISFQDETEKRTQSRLLKQSEEKYRQFFEYDITGNYRTTLEGKILTCNSAFVKMLKYKSKEEIYAINSSELYFENSDRDKFINKVRTEKKLQNNLLTLKACDGSKVEIIENVVGIFDESGELKELFGYMSDITDKIRAEEELRKNENFFRLIFKNSPDVLFIQDCNLIYTFIINPALPLTPEDVIGKSDLDLLPLDEAKTITELKKKIIETGEPIRKEICLSPGGIPRWYDVIYQPIFESDGQKAGIASYSRDITERKLAEEELRKKDQLLLSVMETQQELICRFLPDTSLTFVNKAYCNIFGKNEQELIGSKFLELVPKNEWDGIMSDLKNINVENTSYTYVSSAIKPDGSLISIEWTDTAILNDQNEVIEFQSVGRDITEKLKAEQELMYQTKMQELLRNIALNYINIPLEKVDSIINKSLEEIGRFVSADRTYIFDYDWDNNVCNNTYEWCNNGINPEINNLQNVPLEDIPFWVNPHKEGKAINIPDVFALHETDVVRQILEPQNVKSLITIPIMDEHKCIGFLGFDSVKEHNKYQDKDELLLFVLAQMLVNIKKRINIEQNLIIAKEKAEESDKLKSAFINNISHEIRTPLNSIMGFGRLLAGSEITADKKTKFYEIVEASSNRLMNTVTDYMDMAMIVSGTMKASKKEFQLQPLFEEISNKARQLCAAKMIELKTETPTETVDLTLDSDSELISKIFNILLDNALKFTEKGSISCGYNIKKDLIEFFVQDTGKGIDKNKLEIIFKMFAQGDTSLTRGYEGSGLGLSIANGLIKLLGGSISVTSEIEKGSIFRFTVPFKKNETTRISSQIEKNKAIVEAKPLVLIAEDEESNYLYMEEILKQAGFELLLAENGVEAVELCKKHSDITLILMDIKMPVMNGLEATKLIREFRPELPIIATTAYAQTGDQHRFLAAGCSDYIAKPFTQEQLIYLLKKHI